MSTITNTTTLGTLHVSGATTILNSGTINGIGGPASYAMVIDGRATIKNTGSIYGDTIIKGGTIQNDGLMQGAKNPIIESSAPLTVVNNGTIGGYGGVYFNDGGTLVNHGTMSAYGVLMSGHGTAKVDNFGTMHGVMDFAADLQKATYIAEDGSDNHYMNLKSAAAYTEVQLMGHTSLSVQSIGAGKINFLGSGDTLRIWSMPAVAAEMQHFGAGDAIDLISFSPIGAFTEYAPLTGMLHVGNSAGQSVMLDFQTSTLGRGMFSTAPDAGVGMVLTHA